MQINLAAVARISRLVDLRDIRLIDLSASLHPGDFQLLEPDVQFECSAEHPVPSRIVTLCDYRFTVTSAGTTIAEVTARYVLLYELQEEIEISQEDLQQFAHANGTYHSWPFLRQLLHDLTARMGLPPFTLPVFKVLPREEKPSNEKGETAKKALPAASTKPKKKASAKKKA